MSSLIRIHAVLCSTFLLFTSQAFAHVTKEDRSRNELQDTQQQLTESVRLGSLAPLKKIVRNDVKIILIGEAVKQGHEAADSFLQELNAPPEVATDAEGAAAKKGGVLENLQISEDGKSGAFFGRRPSDQRLWTATVVKNPTTGAWQIDSFILDSRESGRLADAASGSSYWLFAIVLLASVGTVAAAMLWLQKSRSASPFKATLAKSHS